MTTENEFRSGINGSELELIKEQSASTNANRRSELLFAFIAEIKSEFSGQNWDYLDFIAERVISKQ